MWAIIFSGIALGFVSSFHCVGMCGAFAFALPTQHLSIAKKNIGIILYNTGRIITYISLGLIFGFIGKQIYLGGLQQKFSIIAGLVLFILLLSGFFTKQNSKLPFIGRLNIFVQKIIGNYLQQKKLHAFLLVGVANGLLPCGMVYFAIAAAVASGNIFNGALFMLGFGAGTVPLMYFLSSFGFVINISVRNKMRKVVPYFMGCIAVLLILRGMNLGIPYVSPFFENTALKAISCH